MHILFLCGAPRHPHADPLASAVYIGAITSTHLDKSAVRRNRMGGAVPGRRGGLH